MKIFHEQINLATKIFKRKNFFWTFKTSAKLQKINFPSLRLKSKCCAIMKVQCLLRGISILKNFFRSRPQQKVCFAVCWLKFSYCTIFHVAIWKKFNYFDCQKLKSLKLKFWLLINLTNSLQTISDFYCEKNSQIFLSCNLELNCRE